MVGTLALVMLGAGSVLGEGAPATAPAAPLSIPLRVVPSQGSDGSVPTGVPLSAGVPFSRGQLADASELRVVGREGRPVAAQIERRGSWSGSGGVRWLGVELSFQAGVQEYRLVPGTPAEVPGAIRVETGPDALTVQTGRLRAEVARLGGSLRRVWLDETLVLEQEEVQFLATGIAGRRRGEDRSQAIPAVVEKAGPLHTVIRCEGRYALEPGDRGPPPRWILRIHFHANQPTIELQHTFVWDGGLRQPVLRQLGLAFGVPGGVVRARAPRAAGVDTEVEETLGQGTRLSLLQDQLRAKGAGSDHAAVRVVSGAQPRIVAESERAGSYVTALPAGPGVGPVTLVLRDLWQRFPSELRVEPDRLEALLWSDAGRSGLLDLRPQSIEHWLGPVLSAQLEQPRFRKMFAGARDREHLDPTGLARSHRLLLHFSPADAPREVPSQVARAFDDPPLLVADPKWTTSTGALGLVSAVDDQRFPEREAELRRVYRDVVNLVDEWGDYGFLDHGAGPHHAYDVDDRGRVFARPWRYSGLDFGYTRATWVAWLRSGERVYHDLALPRTHFLGDVLRSHVEAPGRRLGDWRFWASGPTVVPWHSPGPRKSGGPPEWLGLGSGFGLDVETLLFAWWLDGDLRSLEVAREVASAWRERVAEPGAPEVWTQEVNANHSRWLFQTLADLSVLAEQFDDPALRDAAARLAAVAIDPSAPGGVGHQPRRSGGQRPDHPSYLFYKAPWMLRYAQTTTGEELQRTREALLRGAEYSLRTRSGEGRSAGLRMGLGAELAGDLRYLARGRDLADAQLGLMDREAQGERGYTRVLHGVLGNTMDVVTSQAALMALLPGAPDPLPVVPLLWKERKRPAASAVLWKDADQALEAEVVHGEVDFQTPDGSPWPASWLGPGTPYLPAGAMAPVLHRQLSVPASAPPGAYRIRAPWEAELALLASNARALRLEAPEGLHLGRGANSRAWSFRFAPGARRVFVSSAAAVELLDPAGRRIELPKSRGWMRIPTPPDTPEPHDGSDGSHGSHGSHGSDGGWYQARALRPAYFAASALGSRYAYAGTGAEALEQTPGIPARVPGTAPSPVAYAEGGLSLAGKGTLSIPAERLRPDQGSIEWWWQPDWDSGTLAEGQRKGLIAIEGAQRSVQLFYRYGVSSKAAEVFELRFEVTEERAQGKGKRRRSDWLGRGEALRWREGQPLHLALEWWSDGEGRHQRLLVDGRPQVGRIRRGSDPIWPIPELPREIRFGPGGQRRGLPFDGTLRAVRVSTTPRQLGAHRTGDGVPAAPDATTSLLCLFDAPERPCLDASGRALGGVSP